MLKVFVSTGCRGCQRALELTAWARWIKPNLNIQIIDLAKEPEAGKGLVFAVPAYVYNRRTVFLGNPSRAELESWLDRLKPEV